MSTIGEALEHEWAHLRAHVHHDHYDATSPKEAPMSYLDTIRNEISNAVSWGEEEFRKTLPSVARVADYAEQAAASAPVQAILGAVLSPEDEQIIVGLVQRLDRAAHQAEALPEPAPAQ